MLTEYLPLAESRTELWGSLTWPHSWEVFNLREAAPQERMLRLGERCGVLLDTEEEDFNSA
jgi:hypothetical protein